MNSDIILKAEFERRKTKNSSYSLRSFARDLDVSPASLSLIMTGKREVTESMFESILKKIGLTEEEQFKHIQFFNNRKLRKKSLNKSFRLDSIEEEEFNLISDPFYLTILNLIQIKNQNINLKWLSKVTKKKTSDIKPYIETLIKLGHLNSEEGILKRTGTPFKTKNDVPSTAIKLFHQKIFKEASERMDSIEVENREVISATLRTSTEKMSIAKQAIREFIEDLGYLLEEDEGDAIFRFNLQLYPVVELQ